MRSTMASGIADHPRVCGGRQVRQLDRVAGIGSSPRVRGTQRPNRHPVACRRIIPACAGDASTVSSWRTRSTDHPRVCGGRRQRALLDGVELGSSPRVRGTRCGEFQAGNVARIIPACAGDAGWGTCGSRTVTDHPRVCGGRVLGDPSGYAYDGSSPRVRGTQGNADEWSKGTRIIPACAGDARSASARTKSTPDHPRVCGGRVLAYSPATVCGGSSPRVRGTPTPRHLWRRLSGIIPACAGDALTGVLLPGKTGGSSPRVRGTLSRVFQREGFRRIIPACAGDACMTGSTSLSWPDHPRVCGGRAVVPDTATAYSRIIPACAGDA